MSIKKYLDSKVKDIIIDYVINRAKEPSTYLGVIKLLASFGVLGIAQTAAQGQWAGGLALIATGILGIVMPDHQKDAD